MSNESMANYITDTPSEIAELLALNQKLQEQIKEKNKLIKEAVELIEIQRDCIDHLLGKKAHFGSPSTVGFGVRVDRLLSREALKKVGEL